METKQIARQMAVHPSTVRRWARAGIVPTMLGSCDAVGVRWFAVRLRVHPSTVRRWILRGEISAEVTPGGHYRFRVSEILGQYRKGVTQG
jgi:excisionase family DNA binding protein